MADYDLDRLLAQVRRIEEHREKGAETEIRRTYQALMKDLRHYLADTYTLYAEEDQLSYAILQKHGYYARFLEEVEQKINDISPEVKRIIRSTVDQTYEYTYNGMIECVKKAAPGMTVTTGLKACTPDVIRRAVENPVSKLTLNDRLEKHRKEIIYDIKQDISVGLMNGDRYSTMANRIKKSVEGDYGKAIRIVRTETHRVREAGNHDAAYTVDEVLKSGESGMQMVKTWRTKKDERVRPAKAKGKNRQYNHKKMDGVAITVDKEFTLPSGAKAVAPGQRGVAGEDINCRCYLSYGLKKTVESDKIESSKKIEFEPAKTIKEAEEYAKGTLGIPNVSYKGVDVTTANEWNRGLSDTFRRFPELKENFGFVGECHERNKALKPVAKNSYLDELIKNNPSLPKEQLEPFAEKKVRALMRNVSVGKNTYAQSWSPSRPDFVQFRGVTVNKEWGKSSSTFLEALQNDVSKKWHPEGCSSIRSVLDHEVGHQLDSLLGISNLSEIKSLFDSRSQAQITEGLSTYAWNNQNANKYGEMIAEAWAEYCNNPEPREIAKTVGSRIILEYSEYEKMIEQAERMGLR